MNMKKLRGFTIIEMMIIAPIVILVIGVFVTAIVSMTGDVLSTRASNALAYNIQDALNRIKQDVNLSGGYLAANNITLTSPQGYDNNKAIFTNAGTNGNMLILNSYATTTNPSSLDRNILYADSQPNPCTSPLANQNLPVMTNIIYFINNNTLWRRVVEVSNYATIGCGTPWQQPSCAPGTTGTICKTQDARLVDGIQAGGFSIKYYPSPNSTTENTTARGDSGQSDSIRQAALLSTNTVEVAINASGTVAGRDISQSGTIRAVSPNNNVSTNSVNELVLNLDAGNTKSYPGSGNTWTDLSSDVNGSNGTLYNVGYSASNGGTLTFDGVDSYATTLSDSFLPLIGKAYTISAWIRDDTDAATIHAGNFHRIISFSNGTKNVQLGLGLDTSFTSRLFYIQERADADTAIEQATVGNVAFGWHNITATSSGTGTWHMYLDGALSDGGAPAIGPNPYVTGTGFLFIGQRGDPGGVGFISGSLGGVSIYNRALNSTEVQQNFNALRGRYGI
jgi:type II secretory pathway pseudopilin PulG